MATLHLMIGLPCSGKTTEAKRLERRHNALRLTPDDWHLPLFGDDLGTPGHDTNHDNIEKIMWSVAARVLRLGVDVILDFGCWSRAERDEFRLRACELGAGFRLHYMVASRDELLRRLMLRNGDIGAFNIPIEEMEKYISMFEPPEPGEFT